MFTIPMVNIGYLADTSIRGWCRPKSDLEERVNTGPVFARLPETHFQCSACKYRKGIIATTHNERPCHTMCLHIFMVMSLQIEL